MLEIINTGAGATRTSLYSLLRDEMKHSEAVSGDTEALVEGTEWSGLCLSVRTLLWVDISVASCLFK